MQIPLELLVLIFGWMDHKSLLSSKKVCKRWHRLIRDNEHTFYKILLRRDFGIQCLEYGVSFKDYYRTQLNVRKSDYLFVSCSHETVVAPERHTEGRVVKKYPPRGKVMFCWPETNAFAYLVALVGDYICWIDSGGFGPTVIHVSDIDYRDLHSIQSHQQTLISKKTLRGHDHPIGLILSNDKDLVSFDMQANIIVWNLDTSQKTTMIEAGPIFVQLLSMSVSKDKIVAAGINGKISVFEIKTGTPVLEMMIPEPSRSRLNTEHLVNVAIFEDMLSYGLFNGHFYVHRISTGQLLHHFSFDMVPPEPTPPGPTQLIPMQRNRTLSEPIVRQRPVNPPPDPEQPIMETPMAPNALALSSSYLLTNGTHNDELILWDLQQGKYLDTLSESKALSRYGLHIPPYRKARFAEFTPDHTCIYTSVEFDSTFGLLIWDYSNQCRIRKIVKRSLPTEDVCDVWICIDSGL